MDLVIPVRIEVWALQDSMLNTDKIIRSRPETKQGAPLLADSNPVILTRLDQLDGNSFNGDTVTFPT